MEGKGIHAHKIVLSVLSEHFRAMFADGFRERAEHEVEIGGGMRYRTFHAVMLFIYTGEAPSLRSNTFEDSIELLLEILGVADLYVLDALKHRCELALSDAVRDDTYDILSATAERHNANQLRDVCAHFLRNRDLRQSDRLSGFR